MKKQKSARRNISAARFFYRMPGDPAPCPTSLEDIPAEDIPELLSNVTTESLRIAAERLIDAVLRVAALRYVRRGMRDRLALDSWHDCYPEWRLIAETAPDPDLRTFIAEMTAKLNTAIQAAGLHSASELTPYSEVDRRRLFVAANYRHMTDEEMGRHLGRDAESIRRLRLNIHLCSALSNRHINYIADHPDTSAADIANTLGVPLVAVMQAREKMKRTALRLTRQHKTA